MSVRTGPEVWKFGGTSVRDAERLKHVAALIAQASSPPVVVVSAMGSGTDKLANLGASDARANLRAGLAAFELAHQNVVRQITNDPAHESRVADALRGAAAKAAVGVAVTGPARLDALRAVGEDLSATLLIAALEAEGVDVMGIDARDVIRTDDNFGAARPNEDAIAIAAKELILPENAAGKVVVVQGFVGSTERGETTTLGRGGSDLTATLLGAALDSPAVHIWTDVDGIMTGDPRTVAAPRVLEVLGFEEAVELAWFGASVLHPGAAKQAVARRVPVRIRSTFSPDRPGTLILEERWGGPEIAAVAHKPNVTLIKVKSRPSSLPYGFLARVFEIMTRHEFVVDLVATSHTSTAFTVDQDEKVEEVARELSEIADVEVRTGLATVTVVGNGLLKEPGFDARVFRTVAFTPVHLISQASDVSLSFVVDGADAASVVARLHRELVEGHLSPVEDERTDKEKPA